MLILNKLLPIFVLPLGFSLLLLVIGASKKRWNFVGTAFALLYVFSTPWMANRLESSLESKYPAIPFEQAESADAIVMLGGVFGPQTPEGYLPNQGEGNERLEGSIQLWQHNKAPWLVFTGGRLPWENTQELESTASTRVAVARGVPSDHIIVTPQVGNTVDEAISVARLMRERSWKKILLVTSACHMPRAATLFRDASVEFVPFAVDYRASPKRKASLLDFLPSAAHLQVSENAIRELYGSAFYKVARWFR